MTYPFSVRTLLQATTACAALSVLSAHSLHGQAVDLAQTAVSAAAPVVPNLIRFSGVLTDGRGYPVTTPTSVTFSLYGQQAGASKGALWQETQHVSPNEKGAYTVYLGAASAKGLPADAFNSVTAQWLGVKVEGEAELARVLLVSVPYALKAGDSATLGGLPASAFALAGSRTGVVDSAAPAGAGEAGISSNAVSNVTTTGGAINFVPLFTGATTILNSVIQQSGSSIGIGKSPNTGAVLDVNGAMIMRGNMQVSRTGDATASKGFPSYGFGFYANAYNSAKKAVVTPIYLLQDEATGNNTSAPGATFNLLYSSNGGTPSETGLYINPNGQIHFAPGQTFPGGGGGGTITGVTAGTGLSGGGTSGNVTLNLNLSAVQTSLNPIYARLGASNSFASSATFAGPITGNSGGTMYAIEGNTSTGFGVKGMATGTNGYGVDGYTTGNGGVGVYGNSDGGADANGNYPVGVLAHALQGFGVKAVVDEPRFNNEAVLGRNGTGSGSYSNLLGYSEVAAGVWGDGTDYSGLPFSIGVIGTSDTSYAGYFRNNSSSLPTLFAYDDNTGTSGTLFSSMMAGSKQGTCGVGGGNLTCTGQIKSISNTASSGRQVETYAVQSPENWMEDFGMGEIRGGSGIVQLDAVFAETVSGSADYHVFLTPHGDSRGLYVTNLTPTSFEVHESGGGTASIGFDYRIVAKRRGFEAQRLTDVTERLQTEMQATRQLTVKKQ